MKDLLKQPPARGTRPAAKPTSKKLTPTLRCAFCDGIVDSSKPDTVCSGACWTALVAELQIDGLPDGIPRDEAIRILNLAGRRRKHIAAYYGISTTRVFDIVHHDPDQVPSPNQAGLTTDTWLAKRPTDSQ